MYIFVFNNYRHMASFRRSSKINRKTTWGQFNLDYIRRNYAEEFNIEPYGLCLIQDNIWQITDDNSYTKTYLNGHILTTENKDLGFWLRMSHHMITKGGTKLIEFYRDIDENYVESVLKERDNLKHQLHTIRQAKAVAQNTIKDLDKRKNIFESFFKQENIDGSCIANFMSFCSGIEDVTVDKIIEYEELILQKKNDFINYLAEKKVKIDD